MVERPVRQIIRYNYRESLAQRRIVPMGWHVVLTQTPTPIVQAQSLCSHSSPQMAHLHTDTIELDQLRPR